MKKKILVIGIISIILIIAICITLLIINVAQKPKTNTSEIETNTAEQEQEEPIVVVLDRKEEPEVEEPEEEILKTPSELTQEIYDINGPIGTLYIPKTGINTEIYSKPNATKMEEMPCFLYTTGGLNEIGTTILVGHNRANGQLFSNNNLIEENDKLYFRDINGTEKTYIVYSKFVTKNDDVSFYNTKVDSPTIAMQCCLTPTDEENVLIIMAKAEE